MGCFNSRREYEKAAATDITISYDTTTLANPRVVVDPLISGEMKVVSPNVPGILRIAISLHAPGHRRCSSTYLQALIPLNC